MSRIALLSTFVLLATVAGGSTVTADEPTCPLPNAVFEYAVPHLDLDDCPAELTRDDAFCRASLANHALHVFAFAPHDEQCLLSVESYDEDEITLEVR